MTIDPKVIFSFLRKNAPTILTATACGGVVLSEYSAFNAGKKYDSEKSFKSNWKCFIKPVLIGIGTIACIAGANYIHLNREAVFASAVAFYKAANNISEELSSDDKIVLQEVKEQKNTSDISGPIGDQNVKIKIWEPYTNQYFEATQQELLWAELAANKMLSRNCTVTLNDVLKLYNDPKVKYKRYGDTIGWSWSDDSFNDLSSYYPAGGWIDLTPMFEEHMGSIRFVMDYGIRPNDLTDINS